jgi:hypothetical protein
VVAVSGRARPRIEAIGVADGPGDLAERADDYLRGFGRE